MQPRGKRENIGCVAQWGSYRRCGDGTEATEARVTRAGSSRWRFAWWERCCIEAEDRREESWLRLDDGEGARISAAGAVLKAGRSGI